MNDEKIIVMDRLLPLLLLGLLSVAVNIMIVCGILANMIPLTM